MKKNFLIFISIITSLFLFAACGPSSVENTETIDNVDLDSSNLDSANIESYPVPTSTINSSYPPPQQEVIGYPAPSIVDESKRFTIDEPLEAGNSEIMGTGPANIPIKVINISYVGETLGSGVTAEDGTFSISLSSPLEANHVIGLQLSDQSLEPSFLDGPDYTNIPMIGLVLTQAVVQQ